MNTIRRLVPLALAAVSISAAAQSVDVKAFLQARGAEDAGLRLIARSPHPAIVPFSFYDKNAPVPACSVLIAPPHGGKPRHVVVVDTEAGSEFPACLGIPSMTTFRLQGRNYVMVEYLSRETRGETTRGFVYLVEDARAGFVDDDKLKGGMPVIEATVPRAQLGSARPLDGIRLARAAAMKQAFPQWRFVERDFIADGGASFATFEDKAAHACVIAAETGAAPMSARLSDQGEPIRCAGVLASSRLATPAATYYLALARTDTGQERVGVLSIATDGSIRVEQELADALNRAGATRDIKTAKAALAARLGRP